MGSRTTVPPGTLVGLTSVFGMGTGEPHRYGRQTVGSTLGGYLGLGARARRRPRFRLWRPRFKLRRPLRAPAGCARPLRGGRVAPAAVTRRAP
uniref:Uncharacterized protein n=1 Tax=uncultured marine microorganism HF4000_ANIW137J11 TaxID=455532 RepID=B3T4Q9_9ZZZZ|nr:hypothetical protein ALOHA_HF4000ANIW137J11ctg1g22 [uncultured marine microorganism HF4000_ANIW137J11]